MIPGIHPVRKARAGKPDRWYIYAWRGGPCIHIADGPRPVIGPDLLSKAAAARIEPGHRRAHTLDAQIDLYRASPEFTLLADSTRRDYRLWLDRISARFGSAPLEVFTDPRMRGEIITWRDQWVAQPRTADKASVMMATLLAWVVDHGRLPVNVAAGIRQLHKVDKSDEVWERRHMRAFTRAPRHLRHALLLAGLTGLRLSDLVKLDWSQVGDKAIILTTQKRKGRAVVPITPALAKVLARIGRDRKARAQVAEGGSAKMATTVLLTSRGTAWTPSGLGSVFQKFKPAGFDRTIHDLRGTFATHLILSGCTDDEAAMIMGWTARRVSEIRARYVNEARVIINLAERLSA